MESALYRGYSKEMGKLKRSLKNYFAGAGSICIGLAPSARIEAILSKTPEQALRDDWKRLGSDMEVAIAKVSTDVRKQKPS